MRLTFSLIVTAALIPTPVAVFTARAQVPKSEEEIAKAVRVRAGDYIGWGPGMSSPGASLEIHEVARGAEGVHIHLTASGFKLDGAET